MPTAPITPERYQRLAAWTIVALGAIVLTGAAVRLTGSGLGCSNWPTCEPGALVPDRGGLHSGIEFGNRLFSIVPAAAAIGVVWAARRRQPTRSDLQWWAWGIVAGVAAQVIIGAVVVRSDLLPSAVIVHFLVSMVLLWNAVVLHDRASTTATASPRARVPSAIVNLGRVAVALSAYVLVSGTIVTGAGPHSGDATDPERLGYFLPDVARLHSGGVIALGALSLGAVVWAWPRPHADPIRRTALWLTGAILAQGAIGYTQYFTGVPAGLVFVHILGSMLVWVSVLRFHFALFERVETGVAPPATAESALALGAEPIGEATQRYSLNISPRNEVKCSGTEAGCFAYSRGLL